MYNGYYDFGNINYVNNMTIFKPDNIITLSNFLKHNKLPFCIKGAGFSHGAQTLLENGLQIDMCNINDIVISVPNNTITVGGGTIWYDVKDNKCVSCMQSYFNFSVGGSISVNCHSRNIKYSSISKTILSMEIMLSNGTVVTCSKQSNYDLFKGVIGGYGLLGLIISATLLITDNEKLKCIVTESSNIKNKMKFNDEIVLYNTNIYPITDRILNFYFIKSNDDLTIKNKLHHKSNFKYFDYMICEQLLRTFSLPKIIRARVEYLFQNNSVSYKSYEMADDAQKLIPLARFPTTTILQEYFIPINNMQIFVTYMIQRLKLVNTLNISLRYVEEITDSVLNYAPVDSCAIVLYINVLNIDYAINKLKSWTTTNISYLLTLGGKYYLPYLWLYDIEQIDSMYDMSTMVELKNKYDKDNKICNEWFIKYVASH